MSDDHEDAGFDRHDAASLLKQRGKLTDEPLPTLGISRLRTAEVPAGVDALLDARDLLAAWQDPSHV